MKRLFALLAASLAAATALAQTVPPAGPPQHLQSNLSEMLCGNQGMPPTSTEIPTIGCFAVPSGGTAAGMFDGHQFVVAVDASGEPKCRFDGAGADCNGCVGPRVPQCPVRLMIVSHNADKSVFFSVQRKAEGNRYLFRIDTWNGYLELRQRQQEVAAAQAQTTPPALPPGTLAVAPITSPSPAPPLPPAQSKPLVGWNAVSNLRVTQVKPGVWTVNFDYFYTGEPQFAALRIDLPSAGSRTDPLETERFETFLTPAQPGSHHVVHEIRYPGAQMSTRQVVAKMLKILTGNEVIASQQIDQVIDWPDFQTWVRDQQLAQSSPEDIFKHAVALIDSEGEPQLAEAKSILERLIRENPRFDAGYVELARIAMKSNWGPEGLHQAASLLSSALEIQPDSANAKILLGYVYAHQSRFTQAEAVFADAARSNPPNLWLWANWGELLVMEGKIDGAITKYREAINRPMTHDTYDRARASAYEQLLALLDRRKDYDGMEALYKQRMAEFGPGACYTADYARFRLQVRGDTQGAIDLARGALNQNCNDTDARRILGLADYVKWADIADPHRTAALNEARIYLPPGPMPLYLLATSERTLPAAKQLLASGEQIDELDNDGLTALAYALQNHDLSAARRLLTLGARPDVPVGPENIPTALIPVMDGNLDGIRMMQQLGVDYTKLRFRGSTALDFAKQSGNTDLLDVLTRGGSAL